MPITISTRYDSGTRGAARGAARGKGVDALPADGVDGAAGSSKTLAFRLHGDGLHMDFFKRLLFTLKLAFFFFPLRSAGGFHFRGVRGERVLNHK